MLPFFDRDQFPVGDPVDVFLLGFVVNVMVDSRLKQQDRGLHRGTVVSVQNLPGHAYRLQQPAVGGGSGAQVGIMNFLLMVIIKSVLLDLRTDFSESRSGGLLFPSLEEFSSFLRSTQSKALA